MSLESFYGGATVFLVTFYRVLSFWLFVSVVLGVNSKCSNGEYRNVFKQMPAC